MTIKTNKHTRSFSYLCITLFFLEICLAAFWGHSGTVTWESTVGDAIFSATQAAALIIIFIFGFISGLFTSQKNKIENEEIKPSPNAQMKFSDYLCIFWFMTEIWFAIFLGDELPRWFECRNNVSAGSGLGNLLFSLFLIAISIVLLAGTFFSGRRAKKLNRKFIICLRLFPLITLAISLYVLGYTH